MENKNKVYRYEIGIETYKPIPEAIWDDLIDNINTFLRTKGIDDQAVAWDELPEIENSD